MVRVVHNAGSGDWHAPTTWLDARFQPPPDGDSVALLDIGSPATVTLTGAAEALIVGIADRNTLALTDAQLSGVRIEVMAGGQLVSQGGTNRTTRIENQGGSVVVRSNSILIPRSYSTDEHGGDLIVADNATLQVGGTVENHGTIALASSGSQTWLELDANTSLTGGGKLILSNATTNVVSVPGLTHYTLTNVDNTIEGTGQLGRRRTNIVNSGHIVATGTEHALRMEFFQLTTLRNSGLIEGSGLAGLEIFTTPFETSAVHRNSGIIQANEGSRMALTNVTIDNTGGTIQAQGRNASIVLTDEKLSNGTLSTKRLSESGPDLDDPSLIVQETSTITNTVISSGGSLSIDRAATLAVEGGTFNIAGMTRVDGQLSVVGTVLNVTDRLATVVVDGNLSGSVLNRGRIRGGGEIDAPSFVNFATGIVVGSTGGFGLSLTSRDVRNSGTMTNVTFKGSNLEVSNDGGQILRSTFGDGVGVLNFRGLIEDSRFGVLQGMGGDLRAHGQGAQIAFRGTWFGNATLGSSDGGVIEVEAGPRKTALDDVTVLAGTTFQISDGAKLDLGSGSEQPITLDNVTFGVGGSRLATTLRFQLALPDVAYTLLDSKIMLSDSALNSLVFDATVINDGIISGAAAIIETHHGNTVDLDNRTDGLIEATGRNALTITLPSINNDGLFEADGGTLKVVTPNAILGAGTMQVLNRGTLDLSEARSFLGDFRYAGRGTIVGPDVAPTGVIQGFSSGNTYVFGMTTSVRGSLQTIWEANAEGTGGTLFIRTGTDVALGALKLSGVYSSSDFSATAVGMPDGNHVAVNFSGALRWAEAVDGRWESASNWNPAGSVTPEAEDNALITVQGGPYEVVSSDDRTVKTVATGTDATLTIDGGRFTTQGTNAALGINEGVVQVVGRGATFALTGLFGQADTGSIRAAGRGATIDLSGGGSVTGGAIVIDAGSRMIAAASRMKSSLDDLTITNNGMVVIDDKTPVVMSRVTVEGAGRIRVDGDATLVLGHSTITGNILELTGGGDLLVSNEAELEGLVLLEHGSTIVGLEDGAIATLTNAGAIKGSGRIGDDDLELVNQGSILSGLGGTLFLDTGAHIIVNEGTIVARRSEGSPELVNVRSALDNRLLFQATGGGSAILNEAVTNSGLMNAKGDNSVMLFKDSMANSGRVAATAGGVVTLQGEITQDPRGRSSLPARVRRSTSKARTYRAARSGSPAAGTCTRSVATAPSPTRW